MDTEMGVIDNALRSMKRDSTERSVQFTRTAMGDLFYQEDDVVLEVIRDEMVREKKSFFIANQPLTLMKKKEKIQRRLTTWRRS